VGDLLAACVGTGPRRAHPATASMTMTPPR
jgi:hypothetical protein